MAPKYNWSEFAQFENLAFRTACNEAAPAADRPLRPNVLRRIAKDADGPTLLAEFIPPDDNHAAAVIQWLGGQPRWRTIVAECIAQHRREIEGFTSVRDFLARGWTWLHRKPADGSPAPIDKIATATVAGVTATIGIGAGAVGAKAIFQDKLSIPVSFYAVDNQSPLTIKVAALGPDGALPISFKLEPSGNGARIPIQLTTESQVIPLQLAASDTATLDRVGKAVAEAAAAIKRMTDAGPQLSKDVAREAETIRQAIADIKTQADPNDAYVKALSGGFDKIAGSLAASNQPSDLKLLAEKLDKTAAAINNLRGIAAAGRTLTTMAAPENQATELHVDWPKPDGSVDQCSLKVSVGRIAETVDVKKIHVKCGDKDWAPLEPTARQARAGDVLWFQNHAFALAVDAIRRPVFGPNVALLRVVSAPSSEKAPSANNPRPATGQQQR